MNKGAAFRGQPLLVLIGLLGTWIGVRVMLWQPPLEADEPARPLIVSAVKRQAGAEPPRLAAEAGLEIPRAPLSAQSDSGFARNPDPFETRARGPSAISRSWSMPPHLGLSGPQPLLPFAVVAPAAPAGMLGQAGPEAPTRWSADAWVLLRRDNTSPLLSTRPSYGRSQAGAVVRFGLAPTSPLDPSAYLRGSAALAGPHERELAAGVSARPLAKVPLRLAAEARASETIGGIRFRPAAYAVSEFQPVRLPLGVRGEAYLQGGYVGGEFATAFIDGQVRGERALLRARAGEVTAGAGAWGGAQKGSARLDVGPTAAASFRIGAVRGRIAADYRFRVAGEAEPSTGPALTVSAGF